MEKRYIFAVIILVYLFIGFIFTILRANAHFNFIINQEDFALKNGKSYWENRCIEENKGQPFPYAQWCVDGSGNFETEVPSKEKWYFDMYSRKKGSWLFVIIGLPLHFLGFDLINFRSIGNVLS